MIAFAVRESKHELRESGQGELCHSGCERVSSSGADEPQR